MPQLAPVNWLFLFFIFWFIVALTSALIWWSSKTEYAVEGINQMGPQSAPSSPTMKAWNW